MSNVRIVCCPQQSTLYDRTAQKKTGPWHRMPPSTLTHTGTTIIAHQNGTEFTPPSTTVFHANIPGWREQQRKKQRLPQARNPTPGDAAAANSLSISCLVGLQQPFRAYRLPKMMATATQMNSTALGTPLVLPNVYLSRRTLPGVLRSEQPLRSRHVACGEARHVVQRYSNGR